MDKKKRIDYNSNADSISKSTEKKQRIIYDYHMKIEKDKQQELLNKHAALKKQKQEIERKAKAKANAYQAKIKQNEHFEDYIQYNEKPASYNKNGSAKEQASNNVNYTVRNIKESKKLKSTTNKIKAKKFKIFENEKKKRAKKQKEQSENIIDLAQARAKRNRRIRLYKIAALCLICIGVIATVFVLFQIETIEIVGKTQYTNTQILEAFGTKTGDNMFLFDANESISNMQKILPYLEDVKIVRKLPGTINIEVTQASEMYSMSCISGWAVLSENLRVLSIESTQPEELAYINGISANEPVLGQAVQVEDERQFAVLSDLLSNANTYELLPITNIDLSDILQINFTYDNKIKIILGTSNDMESKIEWAKYLTTPTNEDALGQNSKGVLDVSNRDSAGRLQAIWRAES